MLLTITTTAQSPGTLAAGTTMPGHGDQVTGPATDLGFLLHKNPSRVQTFAVPAGTAHIFYPEATQARCTVAHLLEVDPVGLIRGRRGTAIEDFSLGQYVNDRPYAASSLLAVTLGRVFRTAMSGRCDARPDLAARQIPLELHLPVVPCHGGPELVRRLFEPLSWTVRATSIELDEAFPAWGDSRYAEVFLSGHLRLADALNHLYVLLPVLDDGKHYWVGADEIDKLVRTGAGWLATHPERALIARRYLANRAGLVRSAMARLAEIDDSEPESFDNAVPLPDERDDSDAIGRQEHGLPPEPPRFPDPCDVAAEMAGKEHAVAGEPEPAGSAEPSGRASLAVQRRESVLSVLKAAGVRRVADLGCGEGALTAALLADPAFTEVIAADVSARALDVAARRLRLDRMPQAQRDRLRLVQSSLTYRDARLAGLDALVLMEVIEHVDPPRLAAVEQTVFTEATPRLVVVTTPNREHNVRFPVLADGAMRHRDHRFEWTRAEFQSWARRVAADHGYEVRFAPVGIDDLEVGAPTQMAVFTRLQARSTAEARS